MSHFSGFGQNCDSLLQKAIQEQKLDGFIRFERQYLNILSICPNHYETHSEIIKFYEKFYTAIPIFALLWQNLIDFKSGRANKNIDKINYLSHRYLEVKRKGTIVHVPPKFVEDWDADYENNMSPLDAGLIVTGAIDFSEDHKNLNSAEKMIQRFDKLFLKIDTIRSKHHGFYWDLYVDFFANLHKTEHFKTAMYIIMYRTGEAEIQTWVDNNAERIADFNDKRNSFISKFTEQQKIKY
jgi:hypothetical protein